MQVSMTFLVFIHVMKLRIDNEGIHAYAYS